MQLRVPVTEGNRYRIGEFNFDGNTVVKAEALRPLFKLEAGDYYNEKKIRKGLDKAREVYGAGGYYEFTGYPGSESARRCRDRATPIRRPAVAAPRPPQPAKPARRSST